MVLRSVIQFSYSLHGMMKITTVVVVMNVRVVKFSYQVGDLTVSEQIVPCQDCKFVPFDIIISKKIHS